MKNVIILENYYSPEQLQRTIAAFVDYCNNRRYNESLDNFTPADIYFGRKEKILKMRRVTKRRAIEMRRKKYVNQKIDNSYPMKIDANWLNLKANSTLIFYTIKDRAVKTSNRLSLYRKVNDHQKISIT